MELLKDIMINILEEEEQNFIFVQDQPQIIELLENKSRKILQKIKAIINEDSLSDFERVKKIICIFENR